MILDASYFCFCNSFYGTILLLKMPCLNSRNISRIVLLVPFWFRINYCRNVFTTTFIKGSKSYIWKPFRYSLQFEKLMVIWPHYIHCSIIFHFWWTLNSEVSGFYKVDMIVSTNHDLEQVYLTMHEIVTPLLPHWLKIFEKRWKTEKRNIDYA